MYNKDNAFFKIIKKELPCKLICESEFSLSFYDLYPKAKVHALVIPKGEYKDLTDFVALATSQEKLDLLETVEKTIKTLDLKEGGYRMVCNTGKNGRQEVNHLHFHILGGELLKH